VRTAASWPRTWGMAVACAPCGMGRVSPRRWASRRWKDCRCGHVRELLASNTREAAEAIELFVYRISRELGSLAAALGGLDVLVFTAGIGEHAAPVRARVCDNAAWLGIRLDAAANLAGGPRISAAKSPVSVWVVPTDEESMIARHTLARTRR